MKTVKILKLYVCILFWGLLMAPYTSTNGDDAEKPVPMKSLKIIATWPHDPNSYCQGLEYGFDKEQQMDFLYESSGRYRKSQIRRTELKTGKVLQSTDLAPVFFAEGLVTVGQRLYLLTWQEGKCFVFDKTTFKALDEFRLRGEGWGLTCNGTDLILSNGSSVITFLDPVKFKEKKRLSVYYVDEKGKKRPLKQINELEYIDNEIWANVYQKPYIVRIDPESGKVLQFFNCTALIPPELANDTDKVLNGIAWDKSSRRLFLTGKCWPILYEMEVNGIDLGRTDGKQ